ncbi:Gfo/Idh/MocA family protein [Sinosporangium siamense]|uniref:Oxidoreductase n=1 Tax=Sinosporangium siamense TaxID=1367973 RepID=A0A919VAS4_9ACTN|nr:Gfo/Idh/MocA family oxidoreductase [Sinosporangium siamense]GII96796.1 oxidoreductase [Sinosporangium siamense]
MLRIGVVGAGARSSLADYVGPGGGRIVAVADNSAAGRERAARAFPEAQVVDDHRRLPALDLDGALVLTPDHTHATVTLDLLRAGIPVYLEKPMATTVADCDAILATARATRTRLAVGHNMRHMPVVRLMKDLIDTGTIGEVKTVWCRHFIGHGGDFYFKDWHAERAKTTGLLLQKGSHDIDVIHWLSGASSVEVVAMGDLMVYGGIADRQDNSDRLMGRLASYDNWPPLTQTGLNPVIDVEDVSIMSMRLGNGVLANYSQCHFAPDYWRNYTVIGTEGRLENFGDSDGGVVRLWNSRSEYNGAGDRVIPIPTGEGTHGGADVAIVEEFLGFLLGKRALATSPVAARDSVAAGVAATTSLRSGSAPQVVPAVAPDVRAYFDAGQP